MDERLMQAFYYSIGGLGLGIVLAIIWSFYIDSQTSSVHIILVTMFLSGLCGFLFPHSVAHIFKFFGICSGKTDFAPSPPCVHQPMSAF